MEYCIPSIPYFLQTDWWYFDEEHNYKLKDGAPDMVVRSYNDFMANGIESIDGDVNW